MLSINCLERSAQDDHIGILICYNVISHFYTKIRLNFIMDEKYSNQEYCHYICISQSLSSLQMSFINV